MDQIKRIGMDTSKHFFQIHGVDASEQVVLRKKLTRKQMSGFFQKLASTEIGMEAGGGSHYWARFLHELGHSVKLMPAQRVKPYISRGKNDSADAEGICEAMSRPKMVFVPVKTAQQQSDLMLVGMRERLIHNRTQLANTIRGFAAEFGYTAAKGMAHLRPLLDQLQADKALPVEAQVSFADMADEYENLEARIGRIEARLKAWHKANECSQRLDAIEGVGPVGATLLTMKIVDPNLFKSGRHLSAWLGLTPKDHSSGGKVRLGGITKAGDEALRSVLIVGATAVIQHVRRTGKGAPWIIALLKRKPPKLVAVALANKTARIAWKLMKTGETYKPKHGLAIAASAN